jgi:hypothetical protein
MSDATIINSPGHPLADREQTLAREKTRPEGYHRHISADGDQLERQRLQDAEAVKSDREAKWRRNEEALVDANVALAVRAGLTPEMRARIYELLVKEDCHGSPQAQSAVDHRLARFGFTP